MVKKHNIVNTRNTLLFLIVILLTFIIFWFIVRPYGIKKDCAKWSASNSKDAEQFVFLLEACKGARGF